MLKKEQALPTEAGQRRTLYQKLHLISFQKGLIIGVLLLALSIPVGNGRELVAKTSAAQAQWQVTEFIDGRVTAAGNLSTIAGRYPAAGEEALHELREAQAQLKRVRTGGVVAVSSADRRLQAAMDAEIAALQKTGELTAEDKRLITGVADTFDDHGEKMRRQAREYDRLIQLALDTYEKLPTRFLFPKPQVYLAPGQTR